MSDLAARLKSTPLSAGSAEYVEDLYERFLEDAESVEPHWREFFAGLGGQDADVAHAPVIESLRDRARAFKSSSSSLPERDPRRLRPATVRSKRPFRD